MISDSAIGYRSSQLACVFKLTFIPASALLAMHSVKAYSSTPYRTHAGTSWGVAMVCDYLHPAFK